MTSDTYSQNELESAQASIALACLIKQIFGRENSSIKRQSQVIHALAKKYPQSRDLALYKREFLAELAIYKNLCRFFSRPTDTIETDRKFCEVMLKEIVKTDVEFAKQQLRELELKESSLTVEGLLTKLEDNQRLLESLEAESPAKSKAGAQNQSDKMGAKQSVAIRRFSNK